VYEAGLEKMKKEYCAMYLKKGCSEETGLLYHGASLSHISVLKAALAFQHHWSEVFHMAREGLGAGVNKEESNF